jgi:hypothetical protein
MKGAPTATATSKQQRCTANQHTPSVQYNSAFSLKPRVYNRVEEDERKSKTGWVMGNKHPDGVYLILFFVFLFEREVGRN